MTHEGHSAARVSGACFVMGQAAGTAAALALARDVRPHALPVAELQRALAADGAFLGRDRPEGIGLRRRTPGVAGAVMRRSPRRPTVIPPSRARP